jgi:hypothetical protein
VLIAATAMLFALDYFQLRSGVSRELRPAMDRATITALMISALVFPVALGIGIGGWKTSRLSSADKEQLAKNNKSRFLISTHTPPKESAT